MLVEDDNNLREIYEARLLAEGYEIVSAKDGEEALAIAVKEKPDLIISDVMMPKISGFDMLDILRSTPETKNTKVIMMTALSQAEDKARADKLGADKYLVKSQVTLEDVARVAREVISGESSDPAPVAAEATASPEAAPAASPVAAPAPTPPVTDQTTATPDPATDAAQAAPTDPSPATTTPQPVADDTTTGTPPDPKVEVAPAGPEPAAGSDKPQPTTDAVPTSPAVAEASTLAQEEKAIEDQIKSFETATPSTPVEVAPATAPAEPVATPSQPAPVVASPTVTGPVVSTSIPVTEPTPEVIATVEPAAAPPEANTTPPAAPAPPEDPSVTVISPTSAPAPPEAPIVQPQAAEMRAPTTEINDQVSVAKKKVIQPLNDPSTKPDINDLLNKELEKQKVGDVVAPMAAEIAPPPPPTPGIIPTEVVSTPTLKPGEPTPGTTVQPNVDPNTVAL